MGLKNWTVTFKSIKKDKGGYLNYAKYLSNNEHRNHTSSDHRIIDFNINYRKVYVQNQRLLDRFNYKKILENKGGRPSKSFGVSVVLSFPFKIEDSELLKDYTNKLLIEYYKDLCKTEDIKYNKNSFEEYKKLLFYNIHLKDTGSKTQINLMLPHYLPYIEKRTEIEKRILKDEIKTILELKYKKIDMSKKKYSYLLKQINNDLARKYLKRDFRSYEVANELNKKKREKLNSYKTKDLNDREKSIGKLETGLRIKFEDLENKIKIFEENQIDDKTLKTYISRVNKKLENNDMEGVKKDLVKIENRIGKVETFNNIDF